MAGPVAETVLPTELQVKSMRASSVGQRWPLASTTSTSIRAMSSPSARMPPGAVCRVSLIAAGGPAVVSSCVATEAATHVSDGLDRSRLEGDVGEGIQVAVLGLGELAFGDAVDEQFNAVHVVGDDVHRLHRLGAVGLRAGYVQCPMMWMSGFSFCITCSAK